MIDLELEVINKLKENNKQINDFKLIELYFQDKFDLSVSFTSNEFDKYKDEVISFVDEYCQNDYPLQYKVGFEIFNKYKIKVNENVLIPRMETEEVVYNFVDAIKEKYKKGSKLKIADICTGSGCILILTAKLLESDYELDLYASDISPLALDIACENFKSNNINATVLEGNLLEPLIDNGIKIDALISNPPYIDYNGEVDENVVKYEPHLALFAENNGLALYFDILDNLKGVLNDASIVAFEIGETQGKELANKARKLNKFSKIDIINDMNKKSRTILLES